MALIEAIAGSTQKMPYNRIQQKEEPQGNQTQSILISFMKYHRRTTVRANLKFDRGSHIQLGLTGDPIAAQNVA